MGGMDANMDEAKGRMKEAAGDIMDDDQMKKEGKADQMGATIKEKAGDMVDKAKDMINKDR
ncbi:MAG TPA: CsbD family protein [Acidimicrobiia bacterium]|nr:CsbD family protein [Acidimicrobiia bacterium]